MKERARYFFIGKSIVDGFMYKFFVFTILLFISTLYMKPLLYIISTSLKSVAEMLDPSIGWLPRVLEWGNYQVAFIGLEYMKGLFQTLLVAVGAAIFQVFSCSMTGYAFARLHIPGKNILFVIVLLTFLIPPQTIVIPLFVTYVKLGWLNTPLPFLIPALFAQGLKGALFILIFRQFYSSFPKELEESARMDGAGPFRTFWKIMLPLSRPAMLIVFLFSFVWHWNNYFEPSLFLQNGEFVLLSGRLENLQDSLNASMGTASFLGFTFFDLNEPIKMAGALLVILPPLILFMFTQRYFVEGIERTGIVE
ncbi:carbohydrate ABC transporter permease [Paenibacillus sp. J5C_2022]|nr:carbohydrate ABC transporter permease [Paenibacillus sp. J5C2022]